MVGARNGGKVGFGCDGAFRLGCEHLASAGVEMIVFGFAIISAVFGVFSSGGGFGLRSCGGGCACGCGIGFGGVGACLLPMGGCSDASRDRD